MRFPKTTEESLVLTPAEIRVVRHVANGEGNDHIARTMCLSIETVKRHVSNALAKRGLDNRTQLAVWWLTHGKNERLEWLKSQKTMAEQRVALLEERITAENARLEKRDAAPDA